MEVISLHTGNALCKVKWYAPRGERRACRKCGVPWGGGAGRSSWAGARAARARRRPHWPPRRRWPRGAPARAPPFPTPTAASSTPTAASPALCTRSFTECFISAAMSAVSCVVNCVGPLPLLFVTMFSDVTGWLVGVVSTADRLSLNCE